MVAGNSDSINILRIVYSIDKKLLNTINIQIKLHPTMNKKIVKKITKNLSKNCEITSDDVIKKITQLIDKK